jgi:origin recognition complex subunit 2
LLVHSIDGVALRNPEAQTCLSWLAKSPFIALVASMDHINGPSIWKEEDSLRFEWLSQNLDTCEPYTDEIELRLAKRAKTADATSNGVKFILQSLTPTDVATLQELARQQLEAADSSKSRDRKLKDSGLASYQSVYEACRKKLLHSTPLAMKNSVKCLEDHGLLKQSRVNTVEFLEIPLPEAIIKTDILRLEHQS